MAKSKTRRRPAGRRPAVPRMNLVAQRHMATLLDDLEVILHAVPVRYDSTDLGEVVEHHYRATAVVNFLRERAVIDLLAGLAGGDMIVMPEDQPALTPPAELEPLPTRDPGAAILALPDVPEADRAELEAGSAGGFIAAVAARVPVTGGGWPPAGTCTTCGRSGLKARPDGSLPRHKQTPGGVWCQ